MINNPIAPWPCGAYDSAEAYRYQLAARSVRIAARKPRKAPAHWAPSPAQGIVAEITRRSALRRLFRATGHKALAAVIRFDN